jgi:hypothetical protein
MKGAKEEEEGRRRRRKKKGNNELLLLCITGKTIEKCPVTRLYKNLHLDAC